MPCGLFEALQVYVLLGGSVLIILKSIGKCRAFCVLQIWANELGLGMILLACRAPQRLCCRKMLHVARCAHSGVCMLQNNCTQVTKCRISLTLGTSNWRTRAPVHPGWTRGHLAFHPCGRSRRGCGFSHPRRRLREGQTLPEVTQHSPGGGQTANHRAAHIP